MKKLFIFIFTICFFSDIIFADKLKRIQENNILKAAVYYDFEPFSFIDKKGRITGFEIDMLRYFASKLNANLQIFQATPQNRFDLLLKNKIDIIPYAVKNSYLRGIDFSNSYIDIKQSFLIKKSSKFINIYNFTGKTIGYFDENLIYSVKENISKLQPKKYYSFNKAVEDLIEGKIDAITENRIWCAVKEEQDMGKLQFSRFYFNDIFYSYAIKEGDGKFKEIINKLIKQSINDGTFDRLYEKWFLDK